MEDFLKNRKGLKHFIESVEKIDEDKSYCALRERVQERKKKITRLRLFIGYAASFILLLGSAYLIYNKTNIKEFRQETVANNIIKPCSNHARLISSDGKQLVLTLDTDTAKLRINGIDFDKKLSTWKCTEDTFKSSQPSYRKIIVPRGAEINILLADGTRVFLNSESILEFPNEFTGKYRKVKMSGEAFFRVAKDKEHPFVVNTDKVNVVVTGTQFNVKAYSDEDCLQTTLVEGGVDVYYGDMKTKKVSLRPSQQAELSVDENISIRTVDVTLYTAWMSRKFVFKDQRLEDIMITLSRWYDVNVFFQNQDLKDIIFSGEVDRYDSINTILECIKKTGNVDIKIDKKTIIFREKWNK